MMRRLSTFAPVISVLLALTPAVARAQNQTLGAWTFMQGPPISTGSITTCSTNAPGGTLWGGNPRQPVLKATASVTAPWFPKWSICALQVNADAPLTVGPASTEVELECVLYGHRTVAAVPARASAVGFAEIHDAAGNQVAKIGCRAWPFIRAAVIANERVHDTSKTTACLDPEVKYTVHGELSIQAVMSRAWKGWVAEAEFSTDDGNGLPSGLMLIVQPRGRC